MVLKDWLTILVPSLVTVIGLAVNYFQIKKSFDISMLKEKESIVIEEMKKILPDILEHANLLDYSISGRNIDSEKMTFLSFHINDIILSYGSKESISILKEYFSIGNQNRELCTKDALIHCLCLRFILFSQIKYEVSGMIMKPNEYFAIKYIAPEGVDSIINKYIEKLKLNREFII